MPARPIAGVAMGSNVLNLLLVVAASAVPVLAVAGSATGRRYDGLGGLSGGGATSAYLMAYPPKQRSDILDALFLPGGPGSLSILKVEVRCQRCRYRMILTCSADAPLPVVGAHARRADRLRRRDHQRL